MDTYEFWWLVVMFGIIVYLAIDPFDHVSVTKYERKAKE